MVIKIVIEFPAAFFIPRYPFNGADPDIPGTVFGDILDDITSDTPGVILPAVIKYMEGSPIVHIQPIPGGNPQNIIYVFENIINRAIGKTIPVIVMLKKKGIRRVSMDSGAAQ